MKDPLSMNIPPPSIEGEQVIKKVAVSMLQLFDNRLNYLMDFTCDEPDEDDVLKGTKEFHRCYDITVKRSHCIGVEIAKRYLADKKGTWTVVIYITGGDDLTILFQNEKSARYVHAHILEWIFENLWDVRRLWPN